jgi:hypothetical protein
VGVLDFWGRREQSSTKNRGDMKMLGPQIGNAQRGLSVTENLKLKTVNLKLFLLLFAVFLFMSLPSISFAAWTIEAVDAAKSFSSVYQKAIAIDKITHQPHIVYGEEHLYHTYFDGIQWQYEIVDNTTGVGNFASIAIDSNNKIHHTCPK